MGGELAAGETERAGGKGDDWKGKLNVMKECILHIIIELLCFQNPIAFLNEVRGTVEYVDLGQWGVYPNITYTVGANIEGIPYSGTYSIPDPISVSLAKFS